MKETLDLLAIEALAQSAPPLPIEDEKDFEDGVFLQSGKIRISIPWDRAFCFYDEDSLKLLKKLGAELLTFSPLV